MARLENIMRQSIWSTYKDVLDTRLLAWINVTRILDAGTRARHFAQQA